MSTLRVANVQFDGTGTHRIDYANGDSIIRISTGAIKVPTGGTSARPTGEQGLIRYNSDVGTFEGHNGASWGAIGGAVDLSGPWNTANAAFVQANGAFVQANAAVVSANLDIVNATRFIVFDDAVTGALNRANVSHGLTYNPSSNTLNTGNLVVVTGNVGIGRANPGFRLDVVGTINASNVLINGAPLSGGATLLTDNVSATRFVTFSNSNTGTFSQANVASSLTFNPATGTLSATIFNATSDANSKQNIKTIENGLDIINSLRGVSFDWKDTGRPSYGLIAQEVEQHLPALVYTDENGKKSLNYDAIIGFLVEAIKELKKNG